jgi:hypothetical protein
MGFFSPWFLAGLAAIGLPLWLHLLRQFQRTPRPFSSLMFFERRVQSSTRHRRLRYLILLVMRIALLALLALAFANPFVNQNANAVSRRTITVIALDRSFSMRQGSRMSDAKAQARRLLSNLSGQSPVQVVAFDSHVEALTQPHSKGSAATAAAVESVQAGDDISSYGELSRGLRVMAESGSVRLNAHVITDAQQSSMPASFADLDVGPHIALTVHPVGGTTANWAVESVSIPSHVYDAANIRVTAVLAGWNTSAASRKATLELDGKPIAAKDVTVAANGRAQVEFDGISIPHGTHRGYVRLAPHDDLPQDDQFAFSVERSDPGCVLFLYSGGRASEAFYYKSALEASTATGLMVQPMPIERLPDQDLNKSAFVVLNNPGNLDDAAVKKISDYIAKGGAVLIAVGPNTLREHVVPVAGNPVMAVDQRQGADNAASGLPVLQTPGQFANVEFLQTARLTARPNEPVLTRFADGSPLLIEKREGEGRMLVFASTLDNSTNDFPLHASFLPFVAQTAAYLAGTQSDPSSIVVGTPVQLRQTNTQNTAADVIGPDGRHLLSLADASRAMSYTVDREGFYDVQRAGRQRTLVAVHSDRRESDLTQVSADSLKIWSNTGDSSADPVSGAKQQIVPRNLWRYFLTLAFLTALVESVFGMRYLARERQTQ